MKLARYLYQNFLYNYEIYPLWAHWQRLCKSISIFVVIFFLLGNSQQCLANQHQKITFLGNKFFSSEKLEKKLFIFDDPGFVEPGLILNDLLTLYKDHGFLETNISYEEQDGILFRINEGERAKINDIKITGIIESKFSTPIKDIFFELKQLGYFDMVTFNNLLSKVKELLSSYGYWDFELKKYKLLLNKNSTCDLLIELDQGPQKLLKKIIIKNDLKKYDFDLSCIKLPILDSAIPFDLRLVDTYKNRILEMLMELDREVTIEHEILLDKDQLNNQSNKYLLVFRLMPKKSLYFGDIIINGCSRTLPEIVMQNLTFKEGEIWDFDKIEQSLKKLKDLNIFKSVSIVPKDFLEKNSHKTIEINVVEDSIFETIARLGFTQVSGIHANQAFGSFPGLTYRLGGSFLWKNISGISDIFRLDFDFTGFSTNFAASYKKPLNLEYLPGITFSSKIFNTQTEQPLPGVMANANQKAYVEKHMGLIFNFDYDRNKFNFFLSAALDCIKISSLNPGVFKALQIDSGFFKNRVPYAILEPSIVFNKFDNDDPSKGYRTSLNFKAMFPLNDLSGSFFKLFFEHSHILPITTNSSFALRFRAGYIFNKNFETILPTERFYLGGLNSIRSYEPNMVPPVSSLPWDDKVPSGLPGSVISPAIASTPVCVPIGAKFMVNLNAEWRCKLFDKLSGVIFNDIGLLNRNKFSDISINDVVGATGFGLRYDTPVGPIRFDIGFKWKRQKEEKPFSWYLTFGQSF